MLALPPAKEPGVLSAWLLGVELSMIVELAGVTTPAPRMCRPPPGLGEKGREDETEGRSGVEDKL